MPSATFTLSSAASTPVVPVTHEMLNSRFLPPAVLCAVSPAGSLTYSVQVTGDALNAKGYLPSTGNWFPLDTMSGLTTSANATLGGTITGIRATVTAYVSGTLTFQVAWSTDFRN